jgi:hypothetical protein
VLQPSPGQREDGEHSYMADSIDIGTIHWTILRCHRNRRLHVARFELSFRPGEMANSTQPLYRREAHPGMSLYRLDVPCNGSSDTLPVDSKPLRQVKPWCNSAANGPHCRNIAIALVIVRIDFRWSQGSGCKLLKNRLRAAWHQQKSSKIVL